jgi:DNA-binding NarL/FixJ family response regulator
MFECEVALNVETARNVLSERQMDVVVMDQNMECVREVIPDILFEFKELDDNMKIIVFNGVADKSLQRKMRRMGADGYLSTKSDLEAVVRSTHRVLGLE